jgi:hypothetical protein
MQFGGVMFPIFDAGDKKKKLTLLILYNNGFGHGYPTVLRFES